MAEVYRAEHIGSFLRPRGVKEAREAFREGRMNRKQLGKAEDQAILEALERQKQIGVEVFCGGPSRGSDISKAGVGQVDFICLGQRVAADITPR